METLDHGGRLVAAQRRQPRAPTPWLDLSTGINPVPYPIPALTPERLTRLPEPESQLALETVAARAYGAPGPDCVAAAPGTQILISLLPLLWPAATVAVLAPTYGEHAAAWRAGGARVIETCHRAELAAAEVGVLGQPNNPDGHRHAPLDLLALAETLAGRGGLLVVDEAFADLEPDALSLAPLLPHPAILILRSFGKSYGLAGLRLGFALGAPERLQRIRRALGPWAVAGPALAAGTAALDDAPWRAETSQRLAADGARLDQMLAGIGGTLVGGTRLFRLYRHAMAWPLADRLEQDGILVRRFQAEPSWLRFGLPGSEADWARLDQGLSRAARLAGQPEILR